MAYLGLPIGCVFCAYEVTGGGPVPKIALAERVIDTPKGKRQVCLSHARAGKWGPRDRRVGTVA